VARPQLPEHEIASVKTRLEADLLQEFESRLIVRERLLRRLLIANGAAALLALVFVVLALWLK
jgi:hypothetical protein